MTRTPPGDPRDIPIIFSRPMVRALLDGRKTNTRRLAWRKANNSIAARALTGERLPFSWVVS